MTPELFTTSGFHAAGPETRFRAIAKWLGQSIARALGLWTRFVASAPARRDCSDEQPDYLDAESQNALLRDARTALRLGFYDEAEALLVRLPNGSQLDANHLNLRGVVCEARRQWADARRWYRRAVRADGACRAAWQNLRRLYELETLGRTAEHPALGDERPALAALLRTRAAPAADRTTKDGQRL